MKLRLKEYSVSPTFEGQNEIDFAVADDKIYYNTQIIQDSEKIEFIINLVCKYKEDIIKLNSQGMPSYKGGRQKSIIIQFDNDDKEYEIIGNTSLVESADLYNIIKDKLISIVEN